MKRLLIAAVVLGVFATTLLVSFPIDAVVRRALEQDPLGDVDVTFVNAGLTWKGLLLEDVRASTAEGLVATLPWLRVRPSLRGLLSGRTLPATLTGSICEGFFDGRVAATRIAGEWVDIELARCAANWGVPGTLVGVADGRIDLTLEPSGLPTARGHLTLRDARWDVPGMPRHLPLEARTADIGWGLEANTLRVHRLELDNDEIEVAANGTIVIAEPVGRSRLALALDVTPRDGMPQGHRDLFQALAGGPPDRRGRRRFRVEGTLSNPIMARPSS